jgi:hypothetical protein
MSVARCVFVMLLAACGGCTVVSSKSPLELDKAGEASRGVVYSLPKGVVDVVLRVEPQIAKFTLSVENLQFVPDPRHQYVLRYQPNPSYKDDITVETNSRSFLKLVKSDTTDRSPEVLFNLAKALTVFGGFEAAPLPADTEELFRVTLDPLDDDERGKAVERINSAAEDYIKKANESCGYFGGKVDLAWRARKRANMLDAAEIKEEPEQPEPQRRPSKKQRSPSKEEKGRFFPDVCLNKPTENHPLNDAVTIADRALLEYECMVEKADGIRRKARSAEVSKRAIAAGIKKREKELEVTTASSVQPSFVCKENDEGDEWQKLCGLLAKQRVVDLQLKKWQDELDDIETKIKAIEAQRKEQKKWCEQFEDLKSVVAIVEVFAYGTADGPPAQVTATSKRSPAPSAPDCSAGICYKPREPYRIAYGLKTRIRHPDKTWRRPDLVQRTSQLIHVDLPNRAELIGIDITRAFLVQKVQEIQFDDSGFLSNVKINKQSELLAASKLPLAVIDAVASGLALRVETIQSQRDLALKQAKLLEAQAKLEETQAQLESAPLRTESAPARARPRKPASASTIEASQ